MNTKVEYWLGWLPKFRCYYIVERDCENEVAGTGRACLSVQRGLIDDGDNCPATYDESYVQISKREFKHALSIFHKTRKEMRDLAKKHGVVVERRIQPGDFIFSDVFFLKVLSVNYNRKTMRVKLIGCTKYDINILDGKPYFWDCSYEFNEIVSDWRLINEEIYEAARQIGHTAITDLTAYLRTLLRTYRRHPRR